MASLSDTEHPPGRWAVRTAGRWFGDPARPQLGWLTVSEPGIGGSGVVIAPPIGYPYLSSHRSLRVLAEALAARGHAVLRIDYDGTGDSAGDQWDGDRVAAWRGTLRNAVDELRGLGVQTITLAGARLGATLALLDAAAVGADAVVAWAPVVTGRRYVKELRLMSMDVPDGATPSGTVISAGHVFSPQTLDDLRSLSLDGLVAPPAPRVLVIDALDSPGVGASETLRTLGGEVQLTELAGGETALQTAAEFATVPEPIIAAICNFAGDVSPGHREPAPSLTAQISWRGGVVDEELLVLAPHNYRGVLSRPPEPTSGAARATLVLLNPGSETHVGPGRMWVELARDLAARGHPVVRVDLRGWGESPDDGRAPGRPYDQPGIQDARLITEALRSSGHDRIVLSGMCASSWIALHALPDCPAAGAVVINPQLFWHSGIPIRVDPDEIKRAVDIMFAHHARGARWHVWDALDALRIRPLAGRWLDRLASTPKPISMIFTGDDVGLAYLHTRLSRQLARVQRTSRITLDVLGEVDHPLHRTWLRSHVTNAVERALDAIDASQSRPLSERTSS